jgi:hypothetical protein
MNYAFVEKNQSSFKTGIDKPVKITLQNEQRQPVNLTGATVKVRIASTSQLLLEKAISISDATKGIVQLSFTPNEDLDSGNYDMELEVTYSNGTKEVFPDTSYLKIKVLKALERRENTFEVSSDLTRLRGDLETLKTTASTNATNAKTQADYAKAQGDYAKSKADQMVSLGTPLDDTVSTAKLKAGAVTPDKINGSVASKNLFDKSKVTAGKFISSTDGTLQDNVIYNASEYIKVDANTQYARNYSHNMAFYDTNKVFISGIAALADANISSTFTTPANAVYVRITVRTERLNDFQLEKGSTSTSYEVFGFKLPNFVPTLQPSSVGDTELKNASVKSEKIPANAILPTHFSQMTRGKNIFNKATVTNNSYVSFGSGTLITPHASYCSSDFIDVEPNTDYTFTQVITQHYAFFDANKVYITQAVNGGASTANVVRTPANAYYMRVTVVMANLGIAQIEKGNVATTYEPFAYRMKDFTVTESQIPVASVGSANLKDSSVQLKHIANVEQGKNLFDKTMATLDKYVNFSSGNLADNTLYSVSDFIPITGSTTYALNKYSRMYAYFDANKTYISGAENANANSTMTSPSNAAYIRLTVYKSDLDSFQFEKGTATTLYEPYGVSLKGVLPPKNVAYKDTVLLFLPSEICIAVGRTIELYNSQVCWTGNINNYHFKWECPVGRAMKRKWFYKGDAAKVGTYTLKCSVYDNNMDLVATAQTTVKVVPATITNATKVLPIGDSLTNGKPWLAETISLSSNKISYVGTRWNGDVKGGVRNHEGRSGATASWYLSDSVYDFETNGETNKNPFWNPTTSKFDFAYYKTTYNINPNVVQLFLGTNGISLDPTGNATSIKGIVDGIRATDANMPIYVVFTLYRGDQNGMGNQLSSDGYSAGSGVWKLEEDRKVYNLMVELNRVLGGYSNLYFIPVALTHDSEYNFMATTPVAVNPRSSITEYQHAEATHPSTGTAGYYQMADIMFSTYAAHLG